jgi:leucyl/phenylalanyl-tRNA--protein transferase
MIPWLESESSFPPVQTALADPNGLLAAGGDLSVSRLLDAYRHGIFPWFGDGDPILWWSPDPRMVLVPEELKVSRSLAKSIRNRAHEIRFDTAFDEVMVGCAQPAPDRPGTWITREMREAYNRLHRCGHAHSVETWIDGALAGGLYGVVVGRMFYGESMFTRVRDASKFALVALVRQCSAEGIRLIDCQMHTPHLASLGARDMPRTQFVRWLAELIDYPRSPGPWISAGYRNSSANSQPCRC